MRQARFLLPFALLADHRPASDPASMHRLHLTLHGRVQGVGFRAFVARQARELGLAGEVRNVADGGVEVDAEGDPAVLERFESLVRTGPRLARVEHVEQRRDEGASRYRGFTVTG
jgi:acylphosphatase